MLKVTTLCLIFLLIGIFDAMPVAQAQTLTIAPENQSTYDDWEPTDGGTLIFTVTVDGLSAANITDGEIRFDFETVSNWEGTCMNQGSGTDPDLYFNSSDYGTGTVPRWQLPSGTLPDTSLDEVSAAWDSSDNLDNFSIDVTVSCRDYGAFGILRIKLYNTSSSSDVYVNEVTIAVPKDDSGFNGSGNYIADKSDTDYGYTNPALDGETGPDTGSGVEENNNPGDGLVEFEEYRGFKVNGGHKRLSPTRKDIFIYSPTDLGIGNASNLPSVFEVHEILDTETKRMQTDRTVNFNRLGTPTQFGAVDKWNVQDTMALWILEIKGNAPYLGIAIRPSGSRNPVNCTQIEICTDEINSYASTLRETTNIKAATNAEAETLQLSRIIGHEIGYGVGLPHTWAASLPTGYYWDTQGVGWYGFGDTSEKITNEVCDLILDEAVEVFRGQAPTTTFLDISGGSSWQIHLNSYVANRTMTEALGSYTFEAGSSIMDYNLKFSTAFVDWKLHSKYPTETRTFTQAVDRGIFHASTYHQLHNWEYQLLGDNATPQTNPQWTPRTVTNTTTVGTTDLGGSVTLSWTVPPDDEPITWYEYRYRENNTEVWNAWTPTESTNTSATISGLINGIIYEFQVRAYMMSGWVYVLTNYSIRVPTTLGAPTICRADSGDGQVNFILDSPSDTGDSPISHYEYRYRENNTDWGDWISEDSNGNSITDTTVDVTGLTNDTDYEFHVRAVNDTGQQSLESNTVTASPQRLVIVVIPPDPPTDLSGSRGDGEVPLSWTAPTISGSSPIIRYEYRYATGVYPDISAWTDWTPTPTGSPPSTSYTVTGLTNGTEHFFQLRAVNSHVAGAISNNLFITPGYPPSAPTDLSASRGDGEVSLSWTAPTSNGTSAITHYEYRYAIGYPNISVWTDWTSTDSTSTSYDVTGLTNGTEHFFQLRAVNDTDASAVSNNLFVTPGLPPSAPIFFASSGDGQVTLFWTTPAYSGTSPITHYEYRYAINFSPGNYNFTAWISMGSAITSYPVTGLTNGTNHFFQIRAVNSDAAGAVSNNVFVTSQAP